LRDESLEQLHPVYRKVNTYILSELILKNYLSNDENELSREKRIIYVHTLEELQKSINSSRSIAFILPPVDLDIIREIAEHNLYMPQNLHIFTQSWLVV